MGLVEGMADEPGGLNDTIAQTQAALAGAMAANAERQTIAHEFIISHGGEVVSGHTMVGTFTPDLGADPDSGGPDAADQP